jgi:hypothetical protein
MLKLHRSTTIAVCLCVGVLAGCAKKDDAAVDTAAADTAAVTTAPTAVNLADVAGTWNLTAVPATGTDTTPTNSVITATSTTSGWTMTLPGRQPQTMRVTVDADSIMSEVGPYASVRRKAQVTTNSVMRLEGGRLIGRTTAHYNVKTADSVLVLNIVGTRAP